MKDMQEAGLLEQQTNAELIRLRGMCDTKAEECDRLRTLQLTDRSVAEPALPTKLRETENYLKLCTEAFHKLKADAITMESTLSRQLTESRDQAGDLVSQLEAARSETVKATQQLTISLNSYDPGY